RAARRGESGAGQRAAGRPTAQRDAARRDAEGVIGFCSIHSAGGVALCTRRPRISPGASWPIPRPRILSIHPAAAQDWKAVVQALPGRRAEDKELLVRLYLKSCANRMIQAVQRTGAKVAPWQCPFAPEFDFVLHVNSIRNRTDVTILSIRAHQE